MNKSNLPCVPLFKLSFINCFAIVYGVFGVAPCFSIDIVRLNEKNPLFTAYEKTAPCVDAKFVGWGENWQWGGIKVKPSSAVGDDKNFGSSYSGKFPKLGVDFSSVTRLDKNQLTWTYNWEKSLDKSDAIGIGIDFKFHPDASASQQTQPELLLDNKGWRWKTPDGESIEVTFTPALAKISFDKNKPENLRALIFTAISKGSEQTTMTVSASKNVHILDSVSASYGSNDTQNWHKDILSDISSPVDLSFLNAKELPAGKHGFVKASGEQLVFEDGTPVKFWGTNLVGVALFKSTDEEIHAHAKRITQLGFNLVRIHHHDSRWVKVNIFRNQANNTQELSKDSLKKLDFWIKCLKDEGVYVWLDLHVGRALTNNDGIENIEELIKGKTRDGKAKDWAVVRGFNYYNESIQKQMQKFNESYLNHVNIYTNLAYKNDPAIVALLITNENDLTFHFGNALLPNKGVPKHNAIFTEDIKRFSETSGLSAKKMGNTWEMGESKIYLADAEHRFNQIMIAHLRGLGAKSMIATTNSWGRSGLAALASLTDGDLIDAHSYGRAEEFNFNPRFNPSFLTWIGAAQVTGKPLSVTEWNVEPFPVADRFTVPIYTAAIANLQGWDAMMLYGYSQARLGVVFKGNNYSSYNDPSIIGLMPAAAILYRQNHVAQAKQAVELKLSKGDFFFAKQSPIFSKSIRTLLETSRFTVTVPETKELPWLKQSKHASDKATVITDANKDFIPEGQDFVLSDTGELKRDWVKGIHTIDTEKSQIVSGWIGGEAISLKDVALKIRTKKAVVGVQSLENKAIKSSKEIFVTVMARSIPEIDNQLPFLSEPVIGEITVTAPDGLKLFPIDRYGKKGEPINASYVNGRYTIRLDDKNTAHWYVLSKTH